MVPFDIQTIGKLDAAVQQVEAAIELFYAKRYAPAVTLAAAAEGCLRWSAGPAGDDDADLVCIEPLFEAMKRGARERYGKTDKEAVERFNALVYWLKHETRTAPPTAEVSNYDAWSIRSCCHQDRSCASRHRDAGHSGVRQIFATALFRDLVAAAIGLTAPALPSSAIGLEIIAIG